MAIDTVQERASAATVATVWNPPSVVPDGAFSQADRQHIAWSYVGIVAAQVLKILANIYAQPTPALNVCAQTSPAVEVGAQPSPTGEVGTG